MLNLMVLLPFGWLACWLITELYKLLTSFMAPEPKGSSLCSQEPTISPYLQPGEFTPHPSNQSA
jgi:hypothetical protein